MEDPIIKHGLFLSPGANVSTAKGGGLSKAHHHKELESRIFQAMQCMALHMNERTPKDKNAWATQIKNRIQMLVDNFFARNRKSSSTKPVKPEPEKTRTMMEKFSDVVDAANARNQPSSSLTS